MLCICREAGIATKIVVKEKTQRKRSSKFDARVLVLQPDKKLASAISKALGQAAPAALVEMAHDLEEAQQLVLGVKPELFVLDVDATPDLGQEFLYDLRTSHPNARAIILTGIHLPGHREQAAGLGAIHFLEKPFPHDDFVDLVQALLRPSRKADTEKFQGTLRDLHITDIIQLKCMSGATSVVEFTGPLGQKARVFFESGQVRHATAPGKDGLAAFNEIVSWKGGTISEVSDAGPSPHTIDLDWQMLLMEATRQMDETSADDAIEPARPAPPAKSKVLVTDDSVMLLSFVKEILLDAGYEVSAASNGKESLRAAQTDLPDLILLDYILPDIKGDEVCRRLLENPATAKIPVVYMSGFGADLQPDRLANPNVIGFLNKPFTSDLLIETVENHMPKSPEDPEPAQPKTPSSGKRRQAEAQFPIEQEPAYREASEVGPEPAPTAEAQWWSPPPAAETPAGAIDPYAGASFAAPMSEQSAAPDESVTGGNYFCGDTTFFSLNSALQTTVKEKLTGTLRVFWNREPVELLVQSGQIILATTRDPELYCPEAPITLANVDAGRIAAARDQQRQTGCPLFIALAQENLILQEPAAQLVQHHGQRLFAQLWTVPAVRFLFERRYDLPSYANATPAEPDVDHWALASLRFIQYPQLGERAYYDPASVPAYTRDGFVRVQNLRLTVAEAQFASQFNGSRSIQQIAKNLRLDIKFAGLTLFRFLALEIVECWQPTTASGPERKGVLQRITSAIGLGE
jgi:DNA-binding response OmpR family regulator